MDNLTHSLLGVTLSRAGFNRLTPHAGWLMLLAANIPDADIVTGLHSPICYLEYHRGWTHSAVWSPLVALGPLLLWWLLVRKRRPGPREWIGAYVASLAGVISHFLMDWLNVYGIRLLLPFRTEWLRLDWVFIVDLWIWLILFVAVCGPLLARLVYSEIGARGGKGRGAAWAALVLVALYLGLRSQTHDRAMETLRARIYQSETPIRVAATPNPANPFRWTGLVETATAWHVVEVNLNRDFDPDAARIFYKPERSAVMDAARATHTARVFLDFASFPVWRVVPVPEPEGAVSVRITDLRFGLPEEGRFTANIVLDKSLRVVRESFEFGTLGTGPP